MTESDDTITIAQMAGELGKAEGTIRQWIREKTIPEHLMPRKEGGRKKLIWDRDQLQGMIEFSAEHGARQGWQHQATPA